MKRLLSILLALLLLCGAFAAFAEDYAAGKNKFVLEAERTDLSGKEAFGYSGSTSGTGMVIGDNTDSRSASGGYYVGWLYKPASFLTFAFECGEDLDDVTVVFRLSAQYGNVDVTGGQIFVAVNYDEDEDTWEQIFDFPMHIESYSEMSSNVKDFQDYLVVENISLKKGYNEIELDINNNIQGVGGTMKAAAPLVDCLILYTQGTITPLLFNPEFGN